MNWITHDKVQRLISPSNLRHRQREKMAKKHQQQLKELNSFESVEERTKYVAAQLFKDSDSKEGGTPVKRRFLTHNAKVGNPEEEKPIDSPKVENAPTSDELSRKIKWRIQVL
ncbi:hypothetical protein QR680_005692 [Steinernema hermaphroditum]|uniref:Uncharacterized protein n=1 Tax=Steinernema hermaphroditum TaxID=289476 RepID=A0AA39HUC6_9BILA|nr:hypothetical protein QR680_005692 [Steinernema hermaphroditum]